MRARAPTFLLLCVALIALPVPVTAAPVPTAAPAATVADRWGPPLGGPVAVTRPFETLPHRYAAGHRGVDLRAAPGAEVLATGAGVVVHAGMVAGRPVVSIDHPGGLRTTYEPVDPSVAAGQQVIRGARIGTVAPGHAGCPAPACLHWGLRRGWTYLDPMGLLRPTGVRLLPRG